jgi:hypothetical protein
MTHSKSSLFVAAAVALSACTSPSAPVQSSANAGGPTDTSHVAPNRIALSGHVFAMQANPSAQGSDTLHYIPIANVSLRLMHNILVNGNSAQELAGNTVSGADGSYRFGDLPSGYYVLYATPSSASGYSGSYSLVPGQSENTVVDVFVWRN